MFISSSCSKSLIWITASSLSLLEPWLVRSGLELGLLTPKVKPPNFYSPHMNVGPLILPLPLCATLCPLHPDCPSLPLLPIWMNVSSLIPWLSDFHTVRFCGSSGYFFVFKFVILLVVWESKVYLPRPPFWPHWSFHFNFFQWMISVTDVILCLQMCV